MRRLPSIQTVCAAGRQQTAADREPVGPWLLHHPSSAAPVASVLVNCLSLPLTAAAGVTWPPRLHNACRGGA
jgi:hypothetical protein